MSLPVVAAGRGLSVRVLGFPVHVDPFFLAVLAFLGWGGAQSLGRVAAWVAIGAVAILVHELGHAFVARRTGARPVINLYGFGGLTSFVPPRPPSRLMSVAISSAGPAVGIAIGLAVLFAVPSSSVSAGTFTAYARQVTVFVNLGWGLLNLLPVLPLDGGQILVQLLPGQAQQRVRRAAAVSIAVAGGAVVVALVYQSVYGALLAGWLGFSNVAALRRRPPAATPTQPAAPAELLPSAQRVDDSALWLLDQGQLDQARHLVDTAVDGAVHPAVRGLLTALSAPSGVGEQIVREAVRVAPRDRVAVSCYARLLAATGDWPGWRALMNGPSGDLVPPQVVSAARLRLSGEPD